VIRPLPTQPASLHAAEFATRPPGRPKGSRDKQPRRSRAEKFATIARRGEAGAGLHGPAATPWAAWRCPHPSESLRGADASWASAPPAPSAGIATPAATAPAHWPAPARWPAPAHWHAAPAAFRAGFAEVDSDGGRTAQRPAPGRANAADAAAAHGAALFWGARWGSALPVAAPAAREVALENADAGGGGGGENDDDGCIGGGGGGGGGGACDAGGGCGGGGDGDGQPVFEGPEGFGWELPAGGAAAAGDPFRDDFPWPA
jgi:hypothetical protein